jgi:hypothetical protein
MVRLAKDRQWSRHVVMHHVSRVSEIISITRTLSIVLGV